MSRKKNKKAPCLDTADDVTDLRTQAAFGGFGGADAAAPKGPNPAAQGGGSAEPWGWMAPSKTDKRKCPGSNGEPIDRGRESFSVSATESG